MVISTIMRNVMSLAVGAECGALFYNSKSLKALRTTLKEMGNPQPATESITENSTAYGIMKGGIKQKHIKAMDVRFYWVCYPV